MNSVAKVLVGLALAGTAAVFPPTAEAALTTEVTRTISGVRIESGLLAIGFSETIPTSVSSSGRCFGTRMVVDVSTDHGKAVQAMAYYANSMGKPVRVVMDDTKTAFTGACHIFWMVLGAGA